MKARRIAAIVTAGLLTAGSLGSAASAASASDSQPLEHFITGGTSASENTAFVMSGPLTAGGTELAKDSHDAYDLIRLPGGTFRLNHPDRASKTTFHVDPTTCFAQFQTGGQYTISNGTGQYRGISGHGSYVGSGQFLLKKTASGTCDQQGQPTGAVYTIHGQGPIHL